jgi:excisionase family DNA binding protein
MDQMLKTREVADRLGVSGRTVRRWINQGTLEARKDTETGRWYIPQAALEDRLEARA